MEISFNRTARVAAIVWAGILAATFSAGGASAAQSVADFYKLGGLRLVVAGGAGGGYDTYSRMFARHYKKHLPGKPGIVVQNMPGASGLTATNWLYNKAPRDGSRILATYNSLLDSNVLAEPKARFDVKKFNWLGSIARSQLLCVTWHTNANKNIGQLVGKPMTVSSTGRTGNSATLPLILNQVLGTKFKVIMGYSTSGSRLALERGEVDGICGLGLSTMRASNPEWFINKKVNIIAQVGLTSLDELKGVPNVLDLVKGENREVVEYQAILQTIGRPYVAPPEVPADRLAALRTAFDATTHDSAFIADMKKLGLAVSPLNSRETDKLIDRLYAYSPETLKRVAQILGTAKKEKVERCDKYSKDVKQCRKKKKKKKKKT